MTSVASSRLSRSRVDHTLQYEIRNDLPPITYRRSVTKGGSTVGAFRVGSFATKHIGNVKLPVQFMPTYQDYMAGCTQHEGCLGHWCVTGMGTILPPQSLASSMGIMTNQFARLVEKVYSRDTKMQELDYRSGLRSMMLGKRGKMRGDMMSGHVDGASRMPIQQEWRISSLEFALPRRMAENMRVLRVPYNEETGLHSKYYREDHIREGDYLIIERPPTLGPGNIQPMKVVFWEHECMGINPGRAKDFHADFDGDEMHSYFVTRPEAIEECKQWKPLSEDDFDRVLREERFPEDLQGGEEDKRATFMIHTTLSVREVMEGVKLPPGSRSAKMKEDMATMFVERSRDQGATYRSFYNKSLGGIVDIMRQRLSQGSLGDMSRQARMAASCVSYAGNGTFHIRISDQSIRVVNMALSKVPKNIDLPLGGNPCIRAASLVCSVAQQAALDSHRVSTESKSNMDLIANMVQGGTKSLVVFRGTASQSAEWSLVRAEKNMTFSIVENDKVRVRGADVIASYNPVVLKYVSLLGGNVKEVCRNGIMVVCHYYRLKPSRLELDSLTELMSYKPEASSLPITTRGGMSGRNMRWMSSLFANHYGLLNDMQRRRLTARQVPPETITEAAAFCNFSNL